MYEWPEVPSCGSPLQSAVRSDDGFPGVRLLRSDNQRPFKVMRWMLEDCKNWLQMRLDMLMMLMKYLARCTRKEILWQDLGEEEEDEQ